MEKRSKKVLFFISVLTNNMEQVFAMECLLAVCLSILRHITPGSVPEIISIGVENSSKLQSSNQKKGSNPINIKTVQMKKKPTKKKMLDAFVIIHGTAGWLL